MPESPGTMRQAALPSGRWFVPVPPRASGVESPRRIWEVDAGAVLVSLGVLLERQELEAVLLDTDGENARSYREDILLHHAVRLCGRRCPFAEAVERLLDARTTVVRRRVDGCPMAALAAWWLGAKEEAEGPQLAALLWSLARDRRFTVRPLLDMVHGDLWVRALRLLARPACVPPGQPRV